MAVRSAQCTALCAMRQRLFRGWIAMQRVFHTAAAAPSSHRALRYPVTRDKGCRLPQSQLTYAIPAAGATNFFREATGSGTGLTRHLSPSRGPTPFARICEGFALLFTALYRQRLSPASFSSYTRAECWCLLRLDNYRLRHRLLIAEARTRQCAKGKP